MAHRLPIWHNAFLREHGDCKTIKRSVVHSWCLRWTVPLRLEPTLHAWLENTWATGKKPIAPLNHYKLRTASGVALSMVDRPHARRRHDTGARPRSQGHWGEWLGGGKPGDSDSADSLFPESSAGEEPTVGERREAQHRLESDAELTHSEQWSAEEDSSDASGTDTVRRVETVALDTEELLDLNTTPALGGADRHQTELTPVSDANQDDEDTPMMLFTAAGWVPEPTTRRQPLEIDEDAPMTYGRPELHLPAAGTVAQAGYNWATVPDDEWLEDTTGWLAAGLRTMPYDKDILVGADWRSLRPETWATSTILRALLGTVVWAAARRGHGRVAMLDSLFWETLESRARLRGVSAAFMSQRRSHRHITEVENDVVIMPLHWGTHWSGCVVYPALRRIVSMDTIDTTAAATRLEARLRPFLGLLWEGAGDWEIVRKQVWQQDDEHSCGPGMVVNVAHELRVTVTTMHSWEGRETVLRYHLAQLLATYLAPTTL
jgi:hypothetical protein